MASRLGRRFLSQVARPGARAAGRNAGATGRRSMSTQTVDYKQFYQGDDKPWIFGSLLFFGSLALYISTGSGKEVAHDKSLGADHSHSITSHGKEEVGQESPEHTGDVKHTDEATAESPSDSEPSNEDTVKEVGAVSDSEGQTVPAEEVKASMHQAFSVDSPKDAQEKEEAEAKKSQSTEGASSQTSEAETKPDQSEKPGGAHTGTLQSEEDSGPTKVQDAREHATSGQAPKQASEEAKSD
ncbi:hypothetical protein OBBRIDRAFT_836398 [Obba rivulosa]|uniref:Uncharacterized protein n=1 Tax=Obba rivulosa TaxID=1052685 RepID=A0A8E2AQB3_9APHY|nr:hypothetical protein OBBRIDRAFT_836398 [Obba rivulosa]